MLVDRIFEMKMGPRDHDQTKSRPRGPGQPPKGVSPQTESAVEQRLLPPGSPIQPDAQPAENPGITQQDAVALVMASIQPAASAPPLLSRVLCSELVALEWMGLDGCTQTAVANMEEIWRTGATLDVDRSLPEGSLLILRREAIELNARVLYCQQNLSGFSVGVQFVGTSEWSPSLFVPAHAVELGSLGKEPPSGDNAQTHLVDDDGTSAIAPVGPEGNPLAGEKVKGLVRSFSLESLAPLIARGSLVALHAKMTAKQPV